MSFLFLFTNTTVIRPHSLRSINRRKNPLNTVVFQFLILQKTLKKVHKIGLANRSLIFLLFSKTSMQFSSSQSFAPLLSTLSVFSVNSFITFSICSLFICVLYVVIIPCFEQLSSYLSSFIFILIYAWSFLFHFLILMCFILILIITLS